jgi:hypothetical protein
VGTRCACAAGSRHKGRASVSASPPPPVTRCPLSAAGQQSYDLSCPLSQRRACAALPQFEEAPRTHKLLGAPEATRRLHVSARYAQRLRVTDRHVLPGEEKSPARERTVLSTLRSDNPQRQRRGPRCALGNDALQPRQRLRRKRAISYSSRQRHVSTLVRMKVHRFPRLGRPNTGRRSQKGHGPDGIGAHSPTTFAACATGPFSLLSSRVA